MVCDIDVFSFVIVDEVLHQINTGLIITVKIYRNVDREFLEGISIPFGMLNSSGECNVFCFGSRFGDVLLFLEVLGNSRLFEVKDITNIRITSIKTINK